MRIYIAVLMCLVAVNCWAQETKAPVLVHILSLTGDTASHPLWLANDELFIHQGISNTPDSDAKTLDTATREFELRDSPNGQLIILRDKEITNPKLAANIINNKGYCVTADYSSVPPSIRITETPENTLTGKFQLIPRDQLST